jgi:hypothetical protein
VALKEWNSHMLRWLADVLLFTTRFY